MSTLSINSTFINRANRFIHNPRTQKAVRILKDNWFDIAVVVGVALIAQDADTTAEYAEATFSIELLEAISEGVVE